MKQALLHIIFFTCCCIHAQNNNNRYTDSLLRCIDADVTDSAKANHYMLVSDAKLNSSPNLSQYYAKKALAVFEKTGKKKLSALANTRISSANRLKGAYSESLKSINKAVQIAEGLKDPDLLASVYQELALLYYNINDLDKALEYNFKCLTLLQSLKQEREYDGIYNNIGIIYAQKGDTDRMQHYFRLTLANELKQNNNIKIGNTLNNLGVYHIMTKNLDSATYYIVAGMKYREKGNDLLGLAGSYNNLALLYVERNDLTKALAFADTSYRYAKRINSIPEQIELMDTYYSIYIKKNDYKKALEYFQKKTELLKVENKERIDRQLTENQSSIDIEKKEKELVEKDLRLTVQESESKKKNLVLILLITGLSLSGALIFFVVSGSKKIRKANTIITEQKHEVEKQKEIIEEKHKDITDSISYAQKIQHALIIPENKLRESLPDSFVLFMPRDVVSGDFYWFTQKDGKNILAVADCTGHGVPGAFMSLIGISLLNRIVNEKNIVSPDKILDELRKGVIQSLNQQNDTNERQDGMDVAVVCWNNQYELEFAGAYNPCFIMRKNSGLMELKPDKQPVGLFENSVPFTRQEIKLEPGDCLYLFSDGITDQFGGEGGKKLKTKGFRQWLEEVNAKDMSKQKEILATKLNDWKKEYHQTDDILLIGVKC